MELLDASCRLLFFVINFELKCTTLFLRSALHRQKVLTCRACRNLNYLHSLNAFLAAVVVAQTMDNDDAISVTSADRE